MVAHEPPPMPAMAAEIPPHAEAPVPVRLSAELTDTAHFVAEPAMPPMAVRPMAEPPSRPSPALAPPAPTAIPHLPPVSLALPPESGLVLVETAHKVPPPPEPEAPAGTRRVRPPRVEVAAEPLQLVETRKESQPPAP
jgi:hypothetical protein